MDVEDNEDGEEESAEIEMHEPYHYLNGLTKRDLEDLLEDIKVDSTHVFCNFTRLKKSKQIV